MAYVISKVGESPNIQYKEYMCSDISELATITNPILGSIAHVYENGKINKYFFIKNTWVQVSDLTVGSITLNDLPSEVAEAVVAATHSNRTILDQITNEYLATLGYYPIQEITSSEAEEGLTLYSNKQYVIGSAEEPVDTIYIDQLVNSLDEFTNEFYFEFYSNDGSDESTQLEWNEENISLQWVDELTIEDNKHYQISIINNVALWCVVDVEAEEE